MSSATKSPGTVVDDSAVGAIAWSNPDNAKVSDNAYATIYLASGGGTQYSHYLKATNFGFAIPAGATINGILVEDECKATNNDATNYVQNAVVRLVKGGTVQGDTKFDPNFMPLSDAYRSIGSSTDKWGLELSAGDVNANDFGVVFEATIRSDSGWPAITGYIDHIRITVYYTVPTYKDGSATLSALGSLSAQSVKVKLGSGIMLAQASLSAFGEKASKGFPVQHLAYRKDLLFTG